MNESAFCTYETAWCPGCGNHVILDCLKTALDELGLKPHEVLLVAGIGQAAKTPQYINANAFCGLHGRALPAAVAAKIANKNLTVIVDTGDVILTEKAGTTSSTTSAGMWTSPTSYMTTKSTGSRRVRHLQPRTRGS
jgi:pyruvate/2-oxoacid:ferredoxin oxidoreductase beta subunit